MVITKHILRPNLKELIESKLSEWDIYHMYLQDAKINVVMRSPFHKDNHPSFSIGPSKSNRLYWRDYSIDEKGGPIDLVERMYGLTYTDALQKIAMDFGLLQKDSTQYKKIITAYE